MKQMTILCLMLVACNRHGHPGVVQISGFETQVYAFVDAGRSIGENIEISDLVIQFGMDFGDPSAVGQCVYGNSNVSPTITVRESYWVTATDQQKEQLIFHEMGHCVLNRPHRNDYTTSGMAVSIMNYCSCAVQSQPALQYYSDHRSDYVYELFKE